MSSSSGISLGASGRASRDSRSAFLPPILYFPKIRNNFEIQKNKIQLYSNQVYVTDQVDIDIKIKSRRITLTFTGDKVLAHLIIADIHERDAELLEFAL